MTRVVIRTDASQVIGGGHVMRCLTLAAALRDRGASVLFLSRAGPGDGHERIRAQGFEIAPLAAADRAVAPGPGDPPHAAWLGADWRSDADACAAALNARRAGPADWIVIDHYGIDARWLAAMRPNGRRFLALDDLDDRRLDADILLDQSRLSGGARRTHAAPTALIGPHYALLRPEFAETRPASLARRAALADTPRRIFISTGLMDVGGASVAAAAALAPLGLPMTVAIGARAASADALRGVAERSPELTLAFDAIDMAALMRDADLAIGAAGATTWERFCLGLPSLVYVLADNQKEIAASLEAGGLATPLGRPADLPPATLRALVAARLADRPGLAEQSRRIAALCDGRGADRVCEAMGFGSADPR